jgi:hypothetical protein
MRRLKLDQHRGGVAVDLRWPRRRFGAKSVQIGAKSVPNRCQTPPNQANSEDLPHDPFPDFLLGKIVLGVRSLLRLVTSDLRVGDARKCFLIWEVVSQMPKAETGLAPMASVAG